MRRIIIACLLFLISNSTNVIKATTIELESTQPKEQIINLKSTSLENNKYKVLTALNNVDFLGRDNKKIDFDNNWSSAPFIEEIKSIRIKNDNQDNIIQIKVLDVTSGKTEESAQILIRGKDSIKEIIEIQALQNIRNENIKKEIKSHREKSINSTIQNIYEQKTIHQAIYLSFLLLGILQNIG